MKKKDWILLCVILAVLATVLYFSLSFGSSSVVKNGSSPAPTPEQAIARNPSEIKYVKIAGKTLSVNLALTFAEQSRGLSGTSAIPENSGMLFVFNTPAKYGFWMKDMNYPLDIIWFSSDGKVVYIKENAQPDSYPETFTPAEDAKYVLEVNAGFSSDNGLKIGDQAEFLK